MLQTDHAGGHAGSFAEGCVGCFIGVPILAIPVGIGIIMAMRMGRWFYLWLGVFAAVAVVIGLIVHWIWPHKFRIHE